MRRPYHLLLSLSILAGLLLGACGNIAINTNSTVVPDKIQPAPTNVVKIMAESTLSALYIPPYYGSGYIDVIEGSRNEGGLVIYTELSADNWKPVIEAFSSHFPWIKVSVTTMGASEGFGRYYTEVHDGNPTADLIVSTDIGAWYEFLLRGEVLAYHSQEDVFLPLWATKNVGLYPISTDPVFIVYNKNKVPNPPTSMQELGTLASAAISAGGGKIITYDAEIDQTGFALNWFWIKARQETGWQIFSEISKAQPTMTTDKDEILTALTTGAVNIGYFVPSTSLLYRLSRYPNLDYVFIQDGQPIFLHYMAISQSAKRQNSARLMLDFLLSQEGQVAIAEGGMTPYRSDIASVAKYHLDKMETNLGIDNLIFLNIDTDLADPAKKEAFLERWRTTFNRSAPPK